MIERLAALADAQANYEMMGRDIRAHWDELTAVDGDLVYPVMRDSHLAWVFAKDRFNLPDSVPFVAPVEFERGFDQIPYPEFLQSKTAIAIDRGGALSLPLSPHLKPHQRDIVAWAVQGGNRAIFASFGLGKTHIQIENLRQILATQGGPGLICCPLGVKGEFIRDGHRYFGIDFLYIRDNAELEAAQLLGHRYFLTNYERIRDGNLDPNLFTVVSLDEASCLRSFGSKTYQNFLTLFDKVQWKFVCTATPSPNRFKELIHYAAFLGVMDSGQALTRFFKRDSSSAGNLTLHPHKEQEFWLWISSWATFLNKPSDLGYSDEGYDLPPLKIVTHRLPVDHSTAGFDSWGQGKIVRSAAADLRSAAREKRDSIGIRVERARQIIEAGDPNRHWITWHELEDERRAIQKAIPDAVAIWGTLDLEEREQRVADFSDGLIEVFSPKPSLAGSGCNLQRHCYSAIFVGINHKFNDIFQAIHRLYRYLQIHEVEIHFIYTESEDPIFESLMQKWEQDKQLRATMSDIIRKHGLNNAKLGAEMHRSIGIDRDATTSREDEAKNARFRNYIRALEGFDPWPDIDKIPEGVRDISNLWTMSNNDNIQEMPRIPDNSVKQIVTSVPFSDHYEYSESYNDFGHNDGDRGFFAQMDYLTPHLLRVLEPGRMACIHTKDRLVYGSVSHLGMYTVNAFSDKCVAHYQQHGFLYCGRITIDTDVVRENSQTYRLGFSENAIDGTKMGVGSPEYVLLFRKPQTDRARAYADVPVPHPKGEFDPTDKPEDCPDCIGVKPTDYLVEVAPQYCARHRNGYSRSRWQFDASAIWRSSGDVLLNAEQARSLPTATVAAIWKKYAKGNVYDYEKHIQLAETLEKEGTLPASFMLLPPGTHSEWIWEDIVRMRTLNTEQSRKRQEMHVCPLQLDVVERLLRRFSDKDDLILDPFAGIGSVGYVALKMRRRFYGIELNASYYADAVSYCRTMEQEVQSPTLFDALEELPKV